MHPRLHSLKTELGEYERVPFTGENTSGYAPFGDRVLILPDQPVKASGGGIIFPEDVLERLAMSAETGIIVGLGDEAWRWNSDRTRLFEGRKPEIGDRVYFERYAGQVLHGDDGAVYRVMDDKAIAAIRGDAQGNEEQHGD